MLFTRCGICGKKTLNFIKNKKINSFNDYWKQVSIDCRQTYARIKYKPGFTYSVCGPFTKHCERIQRFREIANLKHLDRNKLYKACFFFILQLIRVVKI